MSEVFHFRHPCILLIGLALSLFFSGCQSQPKRNKPQVPPPDVLRPTPPETAIQPVPVKPIAEIAKDLGRNAGVVLKGAYVLDLKPNRLVEGRWTHGTIGYLAVGRIVFLDECDTQIRVYRPTNAPVGWAAQADLQTYCKITTSSGLEGLVRSDRVARLKGDVAIATGDSEISVSTGSSDHTFSRSVGTYVEILDDSSPEYYRVRMPWSDPKDIEGRLERTLKGPSGYTVVTETRLVPVPVSFESASEHATKRIEQISGLPLRKILKHLSDQLGRGVKIDELSALMCGLEVNVFAELGLTVAGSGAGVKAQIDLSRPGVSYDYDLEVMRTEGSRLRTLAMVKRLQCNGLRPDRMDAFEIFGEPSPHKEQYVSFL